MSPDSVTLRAPGEKVQPNYGLATGVMLTDEYIAERRRLTTDRVVSNAASVRARQSGLRDLAEAIRSWMERGLYGTEGELITMFKRAYDKLPAIEGLRDVMARELSPPAA